MQQRILVFAITIALTALIPRLIGLADFLTTDEAYTWIRATERFVGALAAGRWAETHQIGHPGVTLMWLGALGLQLERWALGMGWIGPSNQLALLSWMRIGPVLAHALLISSAYLLLQRLTRPTVAFTAALLWATSPFLVAHGRLLHLDALLAEFCTLALLTTIRACYAERPRPWLIAAGGFTSLALLTKGPALILLPFLGLLLFFLPGPGRPNGWQPMALLHRLGWALPHYLLLLVVASGVSLLIWPVTWAAPELGIRSYLGEIINNGGRPNGDGQFFLGSSNPDPGPLFYPIAGLYRLTPFELLGLLGLPLLAWRALRLCSLNPQLRREQVTLLALAAFVLFWSLVMTAGAKKFDRYILPTWPALLTLSAAGMAAGWAWLKERRPAFRPLLPLVALVSMQGASLAWYHPYHLSYFNPLLGGGAVAQRLFLIGWGEGMEQVGAWLRARPDIGHGQIISALPPTLQPFVPVPVQEIRALDTANANYAVVYLESIQRADAPAIYARIQQTIPLYTLRIHGIEYAHVYQLPRPFTTPVDAEFSAALRLRGFSTRQEPGKLVVTPSWDVRATLPGDHFIFLHLYNQDGLRIAQVDLPPGGASLPPTSQWQPGEQVSVPIPLDLPADLPPGRYTLTLGLYDPVSGLRTPLSAGPVADAAWAGTDAALLGTIELTR